ncbi:MAG: dephospho-CoA kinase [Solirubrobacterales bacterium]
MVFIGLTGGVAAGKSTALAELAKLGVPTLSADQAVHDIYEDPEVIALLRERLGDEVVVDGEVDRDAVAREVFAEPEARVWLEQLTWPRVGRRIIGFRDEHVSAKSPPEAVVVEVPLLFEAGMDQAFDKTIVVIIDDELRKQRAAERGHEELAARDERQLPQSEKAERADVVVVNDGDVDQLARRMDAAVAECIALQNERE